MSFDAMTTSPVGSINCALKNGMGIKSESHTSKLIVDFINYMTSYIHSIQLVHSIPNIVSNTLMKLTKGSKLRMTNFEL